MELQLKYGKAEDGSRTVSIPDDVRQRVQAFVRDTARESTQHIASVVQEGHDALSRSLEGVSDAQASWEPNPDDWSILRLMEHIVSTKQIVLAMATNLAQGQRPPGAGPEWEEQSAQDGVTVSRFASLAEARAAGDAAHAGLLALIEKLDDASLDVTFRHFLFGAFNAREWCVFQRIHDNDHAPQVGSIKEAAGYPAS